MKTKYVILMIVLPVVICIGFILMIFLLNLFHNNKPVIESLNRTYIFPDKRILIYDGQSFEDGRVIYLACDELRSEICEIKQDKYPYEDTTAHSCTLNIDRTIPNFSVNVVPFGENRAIILLRSISTDEVESSLIINILHLNECRKTKDYRFYIPQPIDLNRRKIVTYNDTFDIFFKDPRRCGEKECKLTINAEGDRVKGPIGFMDNIDGVIRDVHPIAAYSESKGYVYSKLRHNGVNKEIFFLHPNGTQQQIESYSDLGFISVVEESVGLCKTDSIDSNITCRQYSPNGELKFEFSLNDVDSNYKLIDIYTIPKEGFFMQFLECKDAMCSEKIDLIIMKVNTDGNIAGKFKFQKFNKEISYGDRHMWKNNENEVYCAIISYIHKEPDKADVLSSCFTNDVFST